MIHNLKVFFDKARNGYLIIDNQAQILDANESLLALFGCTYDEIIGLNFNNYFQSADYLIKSMQLVLDSKENLTINEIYSSSIKKFLSITIFYLNEDKLGIEIEDITEKRRNKEESAQNKNKADEFNRFKEILLSNLNHELRTPLNGIIGYSQILQMEITEPSQNDMANMIYQSGKRLLNTLNSILMFSELEADKLKINLDNIHLFSVVKSIVLAFEEICQAKGLELKLITKDKNIFARIDEFLFYKLLTNILDNAVKFTEKGRIVVEIDSINDGGHLYGIIKVIDTGLGINDNQIKYIYNAFRQGSEGLSRKYGGVGLGLTLSKKMIDLLGGEIEIESELNKGTTVKLSFKGSYNQS